MRYKIVMFDLDGTLSDPKIGITKSVQFALTQMGIHEPDLDSLTPFIGPPLHESFQRFYKFDANHARDAVEHYRRYFKKQGMYENVLYPDIPDLLQSLKNDGTLLVVATSKPTVFSEQILEYFHIDHFFDLVVGSNLDGTRASKSDIIHYAMSQYKTYQPSDFVMIGDRELDIVGANRQGIDSMGITYGYGSEEELGAAGATYIAHKVSDIRKFLTASPATSE